ncbi:MAG: anthranilate synthase component II [Bacteroidia bacterium]
MRILLLDNFDSFTYMLKDYLEQCGVNCQVVRNNIDIDLSNLSVEYNALVLSPGPQTPQLAGNLMQVLNAGVQQKMPILGVCLGHQAIGIYFGSKLIKAKLPRHGKVDIIEHTGHSMFKNVTKHFKATRYHSLIVKDMPNMLEPTAFCQNEIMALAHKTLPVWGIQFHPESCQTEFGLTIINNFVALAKTK